MKGPAREREAEGMGDMIRPVRRFVWRPVEWPLVAGARERLLGRRIIVAGGPSEPAARILHALREAGAHVQRLPAGAHGTPEELRQRLGPADIVVDLNAWTGPEKDAWEAPLRQSVSLLQAYYDGWLEETDSRRLTYLAVTLLGGRMGYDHAPTEHPFGGIWAGMAKSLPRELPNCHVKVLDVDAAEEEALAARVVEELSGRDVIEIGYREGRRYTLLGEAALPGAPRWQPSAEDVVLVSGGGRGIGFALACRLARGWGCRVVVTGRGPMRSGEPWLEMDEARFRDFSLEKLRNLPAGETVGRVKQRLDAMKRDRELLHNLRSAEAEGLRLTYEPCDFNEPEQVRALLSRFGPELRGVIHNAGTDAPIRLTAKSPEDFVRTVRVKVRGFLNLLEAVRERPLRFFSSCGSMTGRFGGMAGQVDYGAGNEGLARLGLWAEPRVRFPLATVCWVTWENLGLIANFRAATRYMTAMRVEEGLGHWERELLAESSGEVGFPGEIGQALLPTELGRHLLTTDFPGFSRLASRYALLGEVLRYQRFRSLRTRDRVSGRRAPLLWDFTYEGLPALPVSALLEYALSLGEWVTPEAWPELHLRELREVRVHLPALVAVRGELAFEKAARGHWEGEAWVVDVEFTRAESSAEPLASLRLVYGRERPAGGARVSAEEPCEPVELPLSGAGLVWQGLRIDTGRWSRSADGLWARVRPCAAASLWSTTMLPELRLPTASLEAVLRAEAAERGAPKRARELSVERLERLGERPGEVGPRRAAHGPWLMVAEDGSISWRMEGIRFS